MRHNNCDAFASPRLTDMSTSTSIIYRNLGL